MLKMLAHFGEIGFIEILQMVQEGVIDAGEARSMLFEEED